MRKIITIAILGIFCAACSVAGKSGSDKLKGATYSYTYMYGTMANEYGRGGLTREVRLEFSDGSDQTVKAYDVHKINLPDSTGKLVTAAAEELLFEASYTVAKDNKVVIDSEILPQLILSDSILQAPTVDLPEAPIKFENVEFQRVDSTKTSNN